MAETLVLRGTLEGHEGWVTSIATPQNLNSDVIISASRDKTLLVWKITREEGNYGYPLRSLHGHSHFVEVRPRPADQRARPIDKGPVALSAPGFPDAARVPPRRLLTRHVPPKHQCCHVPLLCPTALSLSSASSTTPAYLACLCSI